MGSLVTSHRVSRLDIAVRGNYGDFQRQFETAVPMWDRDRGLELVERKAAWSEVIAAMAASAPHDFLLYWKLDLAPLMSLAGNKRRATEYLMGNHVIAETMYRRDCGVALYVPLRCAMYESDAGTRFNIEQPSTTLSALGRDDITQIGIDLDHKLAHLLTVLEADVPAVLAESSATAK